MGKLFDFSWVGNTQAAQFLTGTLSKAPLKHCCSQLSSACPEDWGWHKVPLSHLPAAPAPSSSHLLSSPTNGSKFLFSTSCRPASKQPSLCAFQAVALTLNGITTLEKHAMGPLSAVPDSHPGRISALICWKSHLSNNLWSNNLDVFMWCFDKAGAEMSLACLWLIISWMWKKTYTALGAE